MSWKSMWAIHLNIHLWLTSVIEDYADTGPPVEARKRRPLKSFMQVLSTMDGKYGLQTTRLLKKYGDRKREEEESQDMVNVYFLSS